MITKSTVLVLGAGVSHPYGYPTGADLLKDVFQNIVRDEWKTILNTYGVKESEVDEFRSELHQSQKPSVDAFLEHRPEFIKTGKGAIAISLLSRENPDILLDFDVRARGIYHFLYNSLTTDWEEFKQNRLTIITFNYDRSLEYFLFSALKHSYKRSDEEIADAMKSIPIIHVHGSLGPLPWQASGGIDYFPLFGKDQGPSEIAERIRVASENLIIVSEAQPQSQEFELANRSIRDAQRIYFLGFGYFKANLERLGLSQLDVADVSLNRINSSLQMIQYRGSGMGLGSAQMRSIENQWNIWLPDNHHNTLEFLKEFADLD